MRGGRQIAFVGTLDIITREKERAIKRSIDLMQGNLTQGNSTDCLFPIKKNIRVIFLD